MSKFHIDQIASHIESEYSAEYRRDDLDDVNNLSRFLARYSIQIRLGDSSDNTYRLVEITDGSMDNGIDAIAVDFSQGLLVLSQSKWKQNGNGSIDIGDILRFVEGVRSLTGSGDSREPVHGSPELRAAISRLLRTPSGKIALVTVSTGSQPLSREQLEPIDRLVSEMNDLEGVEPVISHVHYSQADIFNSLLSSTRTPLDLELNLLNWGGGPTDPLKMLYGRVSGAEIAHLFHSYRQALFSDNIRVVIPRSDINQGIAETIRTNPDKFVYYNNGIVILSNQIEHSIAGLANRDAMHVLLKNASIVNGAQTVSTLGSLIGSEWEDNLGLAHVLVRCIEVPLADPLVGRGITRYANTQNEVSTQDFAFLDEEQHRLSRELSLLGFAYIIRQSEQIEPEDPRTVIYLRDAAVALACADGDLSLAVTAKREVSRLFAQNGSEYKRIFNSATDPLMLTRAVRLVQEVDKQLEISAKSASGTEYGVAVHGRLAIAHLVVQDVGKARLKDPDWSMDQTLIEIPSLVSSILGQLTNAFPENSYPGSVFKAQPRTRELLVSAGLL